MAVGIALDAERAFLSDQLCASAFLDVHKYCDAMNPITLIQQMKRHAKVCLPVHLAPRFLIHSGAVSKLLQINSSILAGRALSVPWSRQYLKPELRELQLKRRYSSLSVGTQVDDSARGDW